RIVEGDMVVAIRRAPSISLVTARELDFATQQVLKRFPEVLGTVALTGRAEVALDTVGSDNTDVLVRLRPRKEWTTSTDFDDLTEKIKTAIESEVYGTFVSISQPIEDKTNEIVSGSRADVQIQAFGDELTDLTELVNHVGRIVSDIRGTGDIRVERAFGQP